MWRGIHLEVQGQNDLLVAMQKLPEEEDKIMCGIRKIDFIVNLKIVNVKNTFIIMVLNVNFLIFCR